MNTIEIPFTYHPIYTWNLPKNGGNTIKIYMFMIGGNKNPQHNK